MKKSLILSLTLLLCVVASKVSAQDYNYAIGVSLGGNIGLNGKAKLSYNNAIEAGLDYTLHKDAINLYAVWQYHAGLADGLFAYIGGGFNIGGSKYKTENGSKFNLGLDPNVGLEYKFAQSPIALGVDYRPSINIIGSALWTNASFKLRYTF